MLERTAGCLESGSLRRLLPASKQSTKSRRALQSGFWTHGALDLELSPLWTALVRASDPVDQGEPHVQQKSPRAQHTMLLDFLYPAGTLNFLRNYSGWWADRQDGRFARGGLGKFGHRQYTSSAIDTLRDEKAPESEAVGLTANHGSIRESTEFLYKKLGLTRSYDYEEAWRKFMQLEGPDQQPLRQPLIRYFRESERIVDAERTTELFDVLEEGQRDADTYRWAIRAYLKLRNLSDAMKLHTLALENLRSPTGSKELLAHFVRSSSWSRALSLHKEIRDFKEKNAPKFNLYSVLDTIPNLATFAKGLADFANRKVEAAPNDLLSTLEVRNFASEVVRRAIVRSEGFDHDNFLSLLQTLQKWQLDTTKIYEDAFSMLVGLHETKLFVRCYRNARQSEYVKFSSRTLNSVLRIFCKYHSVLGMKQVLDDYFKMYGAPSRHAYKLCMNEFAFQGDAQTVHALFDQYIARFSNTQKGSKTSVKADDFAPLLQVHAKRGEFKQVIDLFHSIESDYEVRPTILCYNILLNAYGKVHDFDMALRTLEKILADRSLTPDDYTFGTMLGICSTRGDIDLAMDIYRMAEELNITPSTAMIDAIVHCYCQDDRLDQAEEQCEAALRMKFKGSRTRMWNYLLVAYAMQRDILNVSRVLQRMTDAKVDYDEYTYSALMQALCMVKQPHRAYSILKDVMPDSGVIATHFHYAIVMGGFIATGELQKVFHVHNRLTRRGIKQSASTNLMLMKGLAEEEQLSSDEESRDIDYKQALDLFQNIMNSADARELSSTTRKGAKGLSLDIAYPAMFYGYIMFILGQKHQFKSVDELYDTFQAMLPASGRSNPPIGILSAFMKAKLREGEHEVVHECWERALSGVKQAASPLPSVHIVSTQPGGMDESKQPAAAQKLVREDKEWTASGNQILPSHRWDLSGHLDTYMKSLALQNKQNELTKLVGDFHVHGFEMDGDNWNHYVQLHARYFSLRIAFQVCETKLMPGWTGWARQRRELPERNRLPLELRRLRKDPRYMRPKYHTLLWLARGYLRVEAQSAEDRAADSMMNWMARECPKTVNALLNMQRSDEFQEREILQQ